MKRTLLLFLSLIPLIAEAQEPQIIGGYLLDGKDSFEELDAAILTESDSKEKTLDGKGMRLPGGYIFMTPENVGEEIGSIVNTKRPFLVRTISFTVEENRMEGCRASIRIYRMHDENNLENIVTMPIYQDIPKAAGETTFSIVPEESIVLDPGKYYISFSLTDVGQEVKEKWDYRKDRIFFPAYFKGSYTREAPDKPLTRWGMNIGLTVRGKYIKP